MTSAHGSLAGVVLAAGPSRRIGRAKALLDAGGRTFVERCVDALRSGGCAEVVAVVRADAAAAARAVVGDAAQVLENADPGSEQIESLRIALRKLDSGATAGVVVLPVDHPLVAPETVATLIDAFRSRGAPIVRAVHDGAPGHPTLFSAALFGELLDLALPAGARSVIARHLDELEDVSVPDPGALADIDTPEEYANRFGRLPAPEGGGDRPGEAGPGP